MATTAKTSTARKSTAKPAVKKTETPVSATAPAPAPTVDDGSAVIAARIAELEDQVNALQAQLQTLKATSVQGTPSHDGDVVDKALLRKALEAMGCRQHRIKALGLK